MTWVNATIVGERPTGLGVYARSLIAALAAEGEGLAVVTSDPEARDREALAGAAPGQPERTPISFVPAPARLRPERGRMAHVARMLWLQWALPRRLAGSRPAVLLNPLPEGPLRSPVPQVTVVHDLIPLFYPGRSTIPLAYLYFRYAVPLLLRASRAVIADSQATRRDVLARYPLVAPERVHVVYPGYDAERFRPAPLAPSGSARSAPPRADAPPSGPSDAPPDRAPYLLYVGNVAPHKNLVRLVEAFAILPRSAATLVIRGSGRPWHEAPVRKRIEELGLADRIDWRPYEDPATLPRLYRGARALVLPSLHEGFGLTALEAMACGTPVIAARAASIPEVVGDAACLVDPLDPPAVAAAMSDVLGSAALAADLRERGLERATLFSWQRTARLLRVHLHGAAETG